ncbi:type I-E CRISPR-associated protein Cse1/CasA [Nocardia sp. NPDC049190]|uniref:type I-E CRISPR-associated protein Cse1/CasA n=1 Tax=Nocardia sp. NPDC049190 TaxID=3155650 RepID=UPI00340EC2CE
MAEAEAGFDLVDQPWINVLDHIAGRVRTVSLSEIFVRAHDLDLAVDDVLEAVALLRQVLLPIYWRSVGVPRTDSEWGERWLTGHLIPGLSETELQDVETNPILAYLADHRARFDLFGDEPFGQAARLRTARGETRTAAVLISSIPTGNSVPLFGVRTDADPPALTPAQAARAMLATQCWDTAGLKSGAADDPFAQQGKSYGNPTGPVGQLGVVAPLGESIAATLLLNTPVMEQGLGDEDIPPWEASPLCGRWSTRSAVGIVDLLTWQARRIRLVPETGMDGSVVVRRVVVTAGDRLAAVPIDIEIHTMWRNSANGAAKSDAVAKRPVRHHPGREVWRDLQGLVATDSATDRAVESSRLLAGLAELRRRNVLPDGAPVRVLAAAVFYGVQSAVVEDVLVDVMPLPVAALVADSAVRRIVFDMATEAEGLHRAAIVLEKEVRTAVRAKPHTVCRAGEVLAHRLAPLISETLSVLQQTPAHAAEAAAMWRENARRLSIETAETLLAAMPPQAFFGQIETNPKSGKTFRTNLDSAAARFYRETSNILCDVPVVGHQEPQ